MKVICPLFLFLVVTVQSTAQQISDTDSFSVRLVADRLADPWEVTFGPDNALWVTESKAYRVLHISPADGRKEVLLDLSGDKRFPRYDLIPDSVDGHKPWPQAGLMGMALHPGLLTGNPYVFLAFHYRFAGSGMRGDGCLDREGGCFFTTRIMRYTYDLATKTLQQPVVVADSLPGSNDHNGGRLLIAPVNGTQYLFYSIGDMGAGQFQNAGRANHAQDPEVYEGKILRFNLDPDTSIGAGKPGKNTTSEIADPWVPRDNPFHNAVFTLGHRNPQGLAATDINGHTMIYSCEHGPFSDDEVNLLEAGKNYGHPLIVGYADGNYNGLAAGATDHSYLPGKWQTTYPLIKNEKRNADVIGPVYRDPLYAFFPTANKLLRKILEKQKAGGQVDWSSEAPGSIEVYASDAIPGWKNSLLITTLKGGKLIRLQLDSTGMKVTGNPVQYFRGPVRYRDLAISPDGSRIFVALDSTAVTSGPTEENPSAIAYRGVILEYRYIARQPASQNKTGNKNQTSAAVLQVKKAGSGD